MHMTRIVHPSPHFEPGKTLMPSSITDADRHHDVEPMSLIVISTHTPPQSVACQYHARKDNDVFVRVLKLALDLSQSYCSLTM